MRFLVTIWLLSSLLLTLPGYAQNSVKRDSLRNELSKNIHDTLRARLLIETGDLFRSANPDSALFFLNQAYGLTEKKLKNKALPFDEQCRFKLYGAHALKQTGVVYRFQFDYDESSRYYRRAYIAYRELSDLNDTLYIRLGRTGLANCHTLIGHNFNYQGNYDEAILHFEKGVLFGELLGDKNMVATAYNNIGNVHSGQGRFDKAMALFLKALKVKEELDDQSGIASCYNNLGIVQWNQGNHEKSVEYFRKSLKIYEDLGETKSVAGSNNNIGNILADKGNYPEALKYYSKAMAKYEELGDKRGLYNCYNNIGIVKTDLGEFELAVDFYNKALTYCMDLGDKRGLTMVYGNLASVHVKMADSLSSSDPKRSLSLKKAIDYGNNAFEIADAIGALPWKSLASEQLLKAYSLLGNDSKALFFAMELLNCKDSMFSEDKTQALEDMQARYESDKKQLQIDKLAKEKALDQQTILTQQAENRKKNIILISALAGLLIVLVFSVIVYRMFRQKKQAYFLLSEQNEEIRQQKEEIQSQRDEIESQRDQVQTQKEQIEELYDIAVIRKNILEKQNKEIEDSIRYAKRIQTSILPSDAHLKSLLGDYFLFFRPKDVVSGDFYWVKKINDWLIITVADCTGHGVPGSLMSMLGVSFLNEIVREKEINEAASVLNKLREFIIEALKQTGDTGTQKDGMDMGLAAINLATRQCSWAGANHNFVIYRPDGRDELIELKGDKMPVGVHVRMDHFTNHVLTLEKGDRLYFFTDGFPDQFGGKSGRKYLHKPFRKILFETSSLPIGKQGEKLEAEFDNWINNENARYPQVDDITILGVQI